ncbi:hydroxyacid dehydrogenase [soil metagenome]
MTKARVTIVIDPAREQQMLDRLDIDRLSVVAEVTVVPMTVASTIEGAPETDAAAEARLTNLLRDTDALVVTHGAPRIASPVLDAAPRLTFIGELEGDRFFGRVDVDEATARGITVVDTTHGSSRPVAEFALAMSILGLRDTWRYARRLQAGDQVTPTARTEPDRITNTELEGRTVGLIGFGHIGWRLTELLRPFHCEVVAYDPFAARELAEIADVTFTRDLDTLLRASDVVVCLVPHNAATTGMIAAEQLAALRPGAVFVNVARGGVVDTAALVAAALRDEQVFCLDVLDPEPIPVGHPLRDLPNVMLTPHLAGATGQSRRRFFALMVDELLRHFAGHEPRAQVTARSREGRGPGSASPTRSTPL